MQTLAPVTRHASRARARETQCVERTVVRVFGDRSVVGCHSSSVIYIYSHGLAKYVSVEHLGKEGAM